MLVSKNILLVPFTFFLILCRFFQNVWYLYKNNPCLKVPCSVFGKCYLNRVKTGTINKTLTDKKLTIMNSNSIMSLSGRTEQDDIFIPYKQIKTTKPKTNNNELPSFNVKPLHELLESKRDSLNNYKQILGNIIVQGDLTIFWGTSGSGKSIFGYQLGECISRGVNFFDVMSECDFETDTGEKPYYKLRNTSEPQKVLYCDFEMSPEQITGRYFDNDTKQLYHHHPNFEIMKFDNRSVKDKLTYLLSIEKYVQSSGTKVVIIDNLSNISVRSEESEYVLTLMNLIKDIQERNGLTMILINHTIKVNPLDPKTSTMMKGSNNYLNFCDSMFCLSITSKETPIRYIIQQKCRYGEIQFDNTNVIEMELIKSPTGNMGYVFNGYYTESEELTPINTDRKILLKKDIKELMTQQKGITYYQISKKLYDIHSMGVKESTFLKQVERIYKLIIKEDGKN